MEEKVVHAHHDTSEGTLGLYASGFVLSVVLTLAAFGLVDVHVHSRHEIFSHPLLIAATIILAMLQFFVQLYFFLHLGREPRPRWKLWVLGFMVTIVLIIVLGSLWIMHNLNYRMTQQQINQYMSQQNGGV